MFDSRISNISRGHKFGSAYFLRISQFFSVYLVIGLNSKKGIIIAKNKAKQGITQNTQILAIAGSR